MILLSIISPTLNEVAHIRHTLESFLRQKTTSVELEILVIDGMSEDGTREVVKEFEQKYPNIHLLDNPDKKTPFAFNIGIARAKGEYVAILGAHAKYDEDYIQTCYDELIRTGSVACSGRVRLNLKDKTMEDRFVKWLQESRFGVSSNSFKTLKEGYSTIINFPIYKKSVLHELGGYDTTLHRNQDNDMNQRVYDKGYKLYHTWKTGSDYTPSDTLKKLYRYAYRNGFWNANSLIHKPKSMKLHHVIPFIFVSGIVVPLLIGMIGVLADIPAMKIIGLIAPLVILLHLIVGIIVAAKIAAEDKRVEALALPALFFAFHFSYGWGTLNGFLKKIF